MDLLEELRGLDVDIDSGIKRLMGNENLYIRMLFSFPDMIERSSVKPDFDFEDYEEVQERVHAIKGVSGNLSLTPIYEAYSNILELLRSGRPEAANEAIKDVINIQNDIVECIIRHKRKR